MKIYIFLLSFIISLSVFSGDINAKELSIRGVVKHMYTNQPIQSANIVVLGKTQGVVTDSLGMFEFSDISRGSYRIAASYVGFQKFITDEFPITNQDYFIEIFLEPSNIDIPEVVVAPNPFRKQAQSPLSMSRIEFRDIEKNAGANRDISKVIQSFAGVSAPVSYRNDLIVRGGGPTENKFYIDGIEIPQINHFATQGASGGPVSILNADLVQRVDFYTGAYPSNLSNGLSAILDIKLRKATSQTPSFKGVVGASEVALSSEAKINDRWSYQVSIRQSYLQLLFKLLDLPFLPTFTDAQFKVDYRINNHSSISILGIGAIDRMKLNTDMKNPSPSNQYILGYLPTIEQDSYTLGASYNLRKNNRQHTLSFKRSDLANRNWKYLNNIETPENLILDYHSRESKEQVRSENIFSLDYSKIVGGIEVSHDRYTNNTIEKKYNEGDYIEQYATKLHVWSYALFSSWIYELSNLKGSLGIRVDANNYSKGMKNPLRQLSPRTSLSWQFLPQWYWNTSAGIYYQLPALTTLGYKDPMGIFANRANNIQYIRSHQIATGFNFNPSDKINWGMELFYKNYQNYPVSVLDDIVLASKGGDYGVWGNEEVTSTGVGRAYGFELTNKLIQLRNVNLTAAYTWVRSEFKNSSISDNYVPSAWDNRHLFTTTASYSLQKAKWDFGAKLRIYGGAPYTPFDLEKSALVEAWDARGGLYYDYSQFNQLRGNPFYQLDIRIDKSFAFSKYYLSIYLDIQNVTNSKLKRPDVYINSGKIINPEAPLEQQKYELIPVIVEDGTILPTIGISFEF